MKPAKALLALFTAAITLAACNHEKSYKLNGTSTEADNTPVLLISLTTGDTLARTVITDGAFSFTDNIEEPTLAQLRIGGRSAGNFVLEEGELVFVPRQPITGTPLNDTLAALAAKQVELSLAMEQIADTLPDAAERRQQLINAYNESETAIMEANLDNPVGATLFLENAYYLELPVIEEYVEKHPSLKNYDKINQIIGHKKKAQLTAEGQPYVDFIVDYEGNSTSLSQLMTPGHYTLVDFWASWCGPCRREIPVIKEILKEYGPKGLDVVGVAVWDEPEATKKAIEELEMPWNVMINAQSGPTDLYGILGIPTILLIAPDGTIVSRGKQGDELKQAVAQAFNN